MNIDEIKNEIEKLTATRSQVIVAIDGRCGSGKTTLAEELAFALDATIFHMDDFFLRKEQRTDERLATPGEFVDHERFLTEILLPVKEGQPVFLRRFSHHSFQPGEPEPVEIKPLVIVEGTYSLHPELRDFYDYAIFATTDSKTQLSRIAKRNPQMYDMFVEKWIPLEELYFSSLKVMDTCNKVLTT